MIIIGELINSTRKAVKKAIEERDAAYIQELAKKQVAAGAHYLDVNAGAFVDDEEEHLLWLMDVVQKAANLPLALDSADPEMIEKGLQAHRAKEPPMINSITAEEEKLNAILPLIKKYNSKVIALCIDDNGMPSTSEERLVIVDNLCNRFTQAGIPLSDVFIDPLVKPVSVDTSFGNEVLNTLEEIKRRYQGVHTICGLSNVSFGLPERKLLNQAFFVMCVAKGMDSVIIDPLDQRIMSLLYASEVLADRDPKCMNYLKAVRNERAKA